MLPHDYTWIDSNCPAIGANGGVHCRGAVYSEAVWSLWKRELQSPPYNFDDNTAHEIVNRLTFLGAGNVGTWYAGSKTYGGCAAYSGYKNYLAVDDDNGNLNDGTPHMQAIFNAFDNQGIACPLPAVVDSGCAGTPSKPPKVKATSYDRLVKLNWKPVAGATSYEIFRTDGVHDCSFGKIRLGETVSTEFSDYSDLQNRRDYYYVVIPKGPSASCFGPASKCVAVTPDDGWFQYLFYLLTHMF